MNIGHKTDIGGAAGTLDRETALSGGLLGNGEKECIHQL